MMQPRLLHIHDFASKDECEHLIETGRNKVSRSTVVGADLAPNVSTDRSSSGMFIERFTDPVVTRLQKRISRLAMLPPEHGEDIQILDYDVGQEYKVHPDFFSEAYLREEDGMQRLATVIVYLSNVTFGGETVFPDGMWKDSSSFDAGKSEHVSDCAQSQLSTRPMLGDAVIFWSLTPANLEDFRSYHKSCPVVEGDKWVATTWFHVNRTKYHDDRPRISFFIGGLWSV